jgi:subtilase family serine protease
MCKAHVLILSPLFRAGLSLAALLLALAFAPATFAQPLPGPPQPLITQAINGATLMALPGNTRPEANAANDLGIVPGTFPMPHMVLQLRRPAAQQRALDAFVGQLYDPQSPNFHHWLSAEELGAQFGPAESDIQTVTAWLQQNRFTVDRIFNNRIMVEFSGTAGQVAAAFHTEIHRLSVNGAAHVANMTDPQIPAALAPAVIGVVALHDFQPAPAYTTPNGSPSTYEVTPSDLATIYNFTPQFNSGNTGQGQFIILVEDNDIYSSSDWSTFRQTFGLSGFNGQLLTIHPSCTGPQDGGGFTFEATLDAEWASAAAPSATIVLATCGSGFPGGVITAIVNLVDNPNTFQPAIMSVSYEWCEKNLGNTNNQTLGSIYQQGAAEGWSIFVASGDGGTAQCDHDQSDGSPGTKGISVNGLASPPDVVAVGGTDFSPKFSNQETAYWNSTNTATFGSAKSYIPEVPWNQSCASGLLATFKSFGTTYGTNGLCNNSSFQKIIGAGGGTSSCVTASNGACTAGWSRPSWQTGVVGLPNNNLRNIPDVSLFASGGFLDVAYVVCWSDPNGGTGANPCTGAPNTWSNGSGTSFAAPIWAGIQALINANAGALQGLPNPRLYQLAAREYGAGGNGACNSAAGNGVASSCIFYDVTQGDNDMPCQGGSANCFDPGGTFGVLSTSNNTYQPAFPATTGWDFATGLGSVNVNNLVLNWSPLLAAVLPASRSVVVGHAATAFATIINTGPTTATNCSIVPAENLPATFVYQTTNPSTNALTGTVNTPVNIAAGASQSFVIALTPSAAIVPQAVPFDFFCTNAARAPINAGLNTLLFSASNSPVPDIVALGATTQNDGIVHVIGAGAFAVATINLGSTASITASANTGAATLPVSITLCQTNSQTGQCLAPPSATVTTSIASNATPTFGIFVNASAPVTFDPANNRIIVTFTDSTNAVRGATSVAVETQ